MELRKGDEDSDKLTLINELARRRGFFWQSYEIYGGVSGFVTYGSLGAKLKQNIENKLRDVFVRRLGILEVESPMIAPNQVFEASGHVSHFKEPMVECLKCKKRFRADHLLRETASVKEAEAERMSMNEIQEALNKHDVRCPECGGNLGELRQFFTMFETTIGPYSDAVGYGRPEAAQGIFVEFHRLHLIAREKLPFGVIQIGHALRNEISPRQGLIRLREFTIADLEFFFDPEQPDCNILEDLGEEKLRLLLAETRERELEEITEVAIKEALREGYIKAEWQAVFMVLAKQFLIKLGVPAEKQRFIEKLPWERAHYAVQSFDQEVWLDRWGWTEVSGHANRSDYDLRSHMQATGVDMTIFKEHNTPMEKEQVIVKPNMAKLGPVFKEEAGKIGETLSRVDPEQIEASFKRDGFLVLGKHRILPEHVSISRKKSIEHGRRFVPHVVEPSFGTDRLSYVALEYAFKVKKGRVVLSLPRSVAPVQVGLYPLVNKNGLPEKAAELHRMLLDEAFLAEYDEAGSIGRRYARADEIGIPLGITVDYDTIKDETVTIRDRDTWKQIRIRIKDLPELLRRYFQREIDFDELGNPA